VYVVIRETDAPAAGTAANANHLLAHKGEEDDNTVDNFNSFRLILYLCDKHDYDLDYLISDNELEIAKRQHLELKKQRA
jgi:hypothetical protein